MISLDDMRLLDTITQKSGESFNTTDLFLEVNIGNILLNDTSNLGISGYERIIDYLDKRKLNKINKTTITYVKGEIERIIDNGEFWLKKTPLSSKMTINDGSVVTDKSLIRFDTWGYEIRVMKNTATQALEDFSGYDTITSEISRYFHELFTPIKTEVIYDVVKSTIEHDGVTTTKYKLTIQIPLATYEPSRIYLEHKIYGPLGSTIQRFIQEILDSPTIYKVNEIRELRKFLTNRIANKYRHITRHDVFDLSSYLVTYKVSGIRCFLVLHKNIMWLVQLPTKLVSIENGFAYTRLIFRAKDTLKTNGTIIEGQLVNNAITPWGEYMYWFIYHDCISTTGDPQLYKKPFEVRLQAANELAVLLEQYRSTGKITSIIVSSKPFYFVRTPSELRAAISSLIPMRSVENSVEYARVFNLDDIPYRSDGEGLYGSLPYRVSSSSIVYDEGDIKMMTNNVNPLLDLSQYGIETLKGGGIPKVLNINFLAGELPRIPIDGLQFIPFKGAYNSGLTYANLIGRYYNYTDPLALSERISLIVELRNGSLYASDSDNLILFDGTPLAPIHSITTSIDDGIIELEAIVDRYLGNIVSSDDGEITINIRDDAIIFKVFPRRDRNVPMDLHELGYLWDSIFNPLKYVDIFGLDIRPDELESKLDHGVFYAMPQIFDIILDQIVMAISGMFVKSMYPQYIQDTTVEPRKKDSIIGIILDVNDELSLGICWRFFINAIASINKDIASKIIILYSDPEDGLVESFKLYKSNSVASHIDIIPLNEIPVGTLDYVIIINDGNPDIISTLGSTDWTAVFKPSATLVLIYPDPTLCADAISKEENLEETTPSYISYAKALTKFYSTIGEIYPLETFKNIFELKYHYTLAERRYGVVSDVMYKIASIFSVMRLVRK